MTLTTPLSKVVQSVVCNLKSHADIRSYWVAYSGGIDSHVLLHVLANHQHLFENIYFHAVHINHALNVKADQWAEHCRKECGRLNIRYISIDVDATPNTGESPEAKARQVRYEAIARLLKENECLLTAHHQDDQVETLLLQLMRGSGPKGLSAMPPYSNLGKGCHVRPLLNVRREDIHAYAVANQLKWITDDSNMDTRLDRNFIRHEVVPVLLKRWPSLAQTVSRSARYCAEAVEILEHSAQQILEVINPDRNEYLSISTLKKYRLAEQRNTLRYWFQARRLGIPSSAQLAQVVEQISSAADDASPIVRWENTEIRRYRDQLYAMPRLNKFDVTQKHQWHVAEPLVIKDLGRLVALPVCGQGVAKKYIKEGLLEVRFRQGGESIQPVGRKENHTLKKLFQERGIPPWVRERTPLLYNGDDLMAVGDLFINRQFNATEGEDAYIFQWESIG